MGTPKTILVAPLHWGLGHATRCIPLIRALRESGYHVMLASDGDALLLLQKEFPDLPAVTLPSYHIRYAKRGKFFLWKLFLNLPRMLRAITSEKKIIARLVRSKSIDGIISDNRPGVWARQIPCVYLTHQLTVLSGKSTFLTTYLHRHMIRKFDRCWVPDTPGVSSLSGSLGKWHHAPVSITYMGILSRMKPLKLPVKYDILVILSGPEPQRSLFETCAIEALRGTGKKVLLVQGKVAPSQRITVRDNVTVVNYMESAMLETAINESALVVSRSGYTTIMDLAVLGKKAFFVPTPGQFEQLYLAKRLDDKGWVPYCRQEHFNARELEKVQVYRGLSKSVKPPDYKALFRFFEGE